MRAARAAFLAAMVVVALAPFYWMAIVSLTHSAEMTTLANPLLPAPDSSLASYGDVLASPQFGRWMLNTAVVTAGSVAIALLASLAAALGLARIGGGWSRRLLVLLLGCYAIPQTVLALPLLVMMSALHLANTVVALLLAYPGLVIPFGTWALWSLLTRDGVRDLLDLARIEGAAGVRLLRDVLLPLTLPTLAAVTVFAVAIVFNDYLYLFTLITGDQATTVMGGVETTNVDVENPGYDFAAMLLGTGPIALVCAWFAERYTRTLAAPAAGI